MPNKPASQKQEKVSASEKKTRYPNIADVVYINKEIGSNGTLINEGNLDFALDRLQWREEQDRVRQGARLLYDMISLHPFMEGNKRTAFVTMEIFLNLNEIRIRNDVSIKEIKSLLYGIAEGRLSADDAHEVLKEWTK